MVAQGAELKRNTSGEAGALLRQAEPEPLRPA